VSTLGYNAFSTSVGDFNNDGRLDIFLGTINTPSQSDNLAFDESEIIYSLYKNSENDPSILTFRSQSGILNFNLDQHIKLTDLRPTAVAEDIYIGELKINPAARKFDLRTNEAEGAPADFDKPGVYIWYSPDTQDWHMKWVFHEALNEFKGAVKGVGISDVTRTNFTTNQSEQNADVIFINQGHGEFARLCPALAVHREATSDSTVADFNNDGWLDVIGLRQGEPGSPNGELFVLTNNAGASFSASAIGLRNIDRLRNSDLIVHGFFDEDDKPDIFLTNGYGQIPGNDGEPRLLLNSSTTGNSALMVDLEGVTANRFGIGAKLTLTDANGEIVGFRVQGLNSNITQDTHWTHFGLGRFPAPFRLQVEWPDGVTTDHSFSGPGRYPLRQSGVE
jgi:hypothetical protein